MLEEVSMLQQEIEDIIIDNTYPAKEIAEHVMEFMEWIVLSANSMGFENETFELKPVWYRQDEDKDYSVEEMYNYWKINVKENKFGITSAARTIKEEDLDRQRDAYYNRDKLFERKPK